MPAAGWGQVQDLANHGRSLLQESDVSLLQVPCGTGSNSEPSMDVVGARWKACTVCSIAEEDPCVSFEVDMDGLDGVIRTGRIQ